MVKINEFIKKENPDILCLQELSFPANLYVPKNYKRVGLSIYHHIYVRKGIKARPLWFSIHHNGAKINDVRIINIHGTWRKCMKKVWQKLRIKLLDVYAFTNCSKLSSMIINAKTPPNLYSDTTFNGVNNVIFYVPSESLDNYKSDYFWSRYTAKIQAIPE